MRSPKSSVSPPSTRTTSTPPSTISARARRPIEKTLYRRYLDRRGAPPALFLYDVTSSYLEGELNALGEYGYPRDGKPGKLQIVIGLLADDQGEPLAVRVFAGNTGDPATVAEQIRILKEQFGVQELVFVGDRGMVKSKGKQALKDEGLRYISALTDPQIRKLLSTGTLQMSLFAEQVCEVEADGVRYVLRKNEAEEARVHHRWEDKLAKLGGKVERRNQRGEGIQALPAGGGPAPATGLGVAPQADGTGGVARGRPRHRAGAPAAAIDQAMQLAGCYVVVTDVPKQQMNEQAVHDNYVSLQKVERDFRQLKTGLLEVRPVFVRKESRTRGHVFCCMLALKLSREIERRLQAAFGTTDADPYALTVGDALAALSRLCLLEYQIDDKTKLTRLPRSRRTPERNPCGARCQPAQRSKAVDRSPLPRKASNSHPPRQIPAKSRPPGGGRSVRKQLRVWKETGPSVGLTDKYAFMNFSTWSFTVFAGCWDDHKPTERTNPMDGPCRRAGGLDGWVPDQKGRLMQFQVNRSNVGFAC